MESLVVVKRRRSGSMPAVMEAIDRMTISEKFDVTITAGCRLPTAIHSSRMVAVSRYPIRFR